MSGDGRVLASVVERGGRDTLLLQEQPSGRELPLRHLRRFQPHRSPSLSWNGRYVAVLIQQGSRRLAVIEDRVNGNLLRFPYPATRRWSGSRWPRAAGAWPWRWCTTASTGFRCSIWRTSWNPTCRRGCSAAAAPSSGGALNHGDGTPGLVRWARNLGARPGRVGASAAQRLLGHAAGADGRP